MILHIQRFAKRAAYTIGRLYIDGVYFCDILEDTDRGLDSSMTLAQIQRIKVHGKTAIPTGIYDVLLSYSPKFASRPWATKYRGMLPLINGIPGFSRVFLRCLRRRERRLIRIQFQVLLILRLFARCVWFKVSVPAV